MNRIGNRLNIFIDETGEFGFKKGAAKFYGVSMVFHEQNSDITDALNQLNHRLDLLNFHAMIHMGDLVCGHGDYKDLDILSRRETYKSLYNFSSKVPTRYKTIIVEKRNLDNVSALQTAIEAKLKATIVDNLEYLQKFNQIVVY